MDNKAFSLRCLVSDFFVLSDNPKYAFINDN
jgi:hypothetical protein